MFQIGFHEQLDFFLGHNVVCVPLDSVFAWIRIVVHRLVDEDGYVHCHGIPACILIIDYQQIPIVLYGHKNIVLM